MGKDLNGKELGEGLSQLKDGRYCARYTDYYGKRKSIYGKKLKEVKDKFNKAKYESKLCAGELDANRLTLDELYRIWYQWKEQEVKASTLYGYDCVYQSNIKPQLGSMKIQKIRSVDIQTLINNYLEYLARGTVLIIKNVLSNIFKFALKHHYVLVNPCETIKVKKNTDEDINLNCTKYLTNQQLKALFDYAETKKHKHLILYKFLLLTGLRIGEAVALQWSDIDFKNKLLHVTKTEVCYYKNGRRMITHNQTPKTQTSVRTIPLCKDALLLLMLQRDSKYTSDKHIFVSTKHKPLERNSVEICLSRLIDRFNKTQVTPLPKFTPHTFRHTFASRCLDHGIPLKVIQQILGHSRMSTTMDIYTHIPDGYLQEFAHKISL